MTGLRLNKEQLNIVDECKSILSPILDQSGGILYSSCDTLKRGHFYVLGLNPGGDDRSTIKDSLRVMSSYKENAYLDEEWGTDKRKYGKGSHPLQKNLKYLFDFLEYDLRDICSSNLIFVRTPNQNSLAFDFYANLCWKVHELFLKIIEPNVLIVFGNSKISPYSYIASLNKEKGEKNLIEDNIPSNHGNWVCRSFVTNLYGSRKLILGLPHLSRYRIYGNDRKSVRDWIKNKVFNML